MLWALQVCHLSEPVWKQNHNSLFFILSRSTMEGHRDSGFPGCGCYSQKDLNNQDVFNFRTQNILVVQVLRTVIFTSRWVTSALSDFPCCGRGAGERPFFPGVRRKEASASSDLQTVITKIAWNLRQWWPSFVTETYKLEPSRHQLHNGERFVHVLLRSLSRFPTKTHTKKTPKIHVQYPEG